MTQNVLQSRWIRSERGWVAGVCQGLGERFDTSPGVLRALWMMSILFFGVGLFFYFICAFCLPVEGKEHLVDEGKILGVCARLSEKFDMDVGLLRILAVIIGLGSFGTTILAYIILHFLIPSNENTLKNLNE
ncbi:MAG: PspC domain-containing protein [Bdellovibrionales bacterium]|nr:PspC domain-containing protein [Bdellovibrionales bacterium]NQZ17734.1 PspC domain-containing protein [Bdellovibrionales bacterium]